MIRTSRIGTQKGVEPRLHEPGAPIPHPAVLLTDADERSTLACARSLRRLGCSVHVAAHASRSLAGASVGVTGHVVSTPPNHAPFDYVSRLSEIVRGHAIRYLVPMTDYSMEAVLQHRTLLPNDIRVIAPSVSSYQTASNKAELSRLAGQAGFAVPESVRIDSPGPNELPDASFFPAVVKPYRSVVASGTGQRKLQVVLVANRERCQRELDALPREAFPVLLQRRIVGPGEGYFGLRWGGKIVAQFCHRRLREKPPSGGVSVYRESIPLDPGLAAPGARLLELLDWEGVVMVECKRDTTTGRHMVMEANGRFWGSLQLAIDAGVDFPALLVRSALGEDVRPVTEYRAGIRSRWLWGDLDHLYMRLRYSPEALDLPHGAPSRLAAIGQFLRVRLGDRLEVLRWRDPGPFIVETLARFGIGR